MMIIEASLHLQNMPFMLRKRFYDSVYIWYIFLA